MKAIAGASSNVIWQGKSLFRIRPNNHLADELIRNRSAVMLFHYEGGMHQVKAWQTHVLKTHRIEYLRKSHQPRLRLGGTPESGSVYASELKDVIVVTGSPKFDLCLTMEWVTATKSGELRDKSEPLILISIQLCCGRIQATTSPPIVVNRDFSAFALDSRRQGHSNCATGSRLSSPAVRFEPSSKCEGRDELDVEVAREAGHVAGSVNEALDTSNRLVTDVLRFSISSLATFGPRAPINAPPEEFSRALAAVFLKLLLRSFRGASTHMARAISLHGNF
jgi:hypothetical protein